jgi:hypothetical protein
MLITVKLDNETQREYEVVTNRAGFKKRFVYAHSAAEYFGIDSAELQRRLKNGPVFVVSDDQGTRMV